ncbi:MAG: hypothetical protein ACRCV9_01220 [Burkholderiaceae bacterium]
MPETQAVASQAIAIAYFACNAVRIVSFVPTIAKLRRPRAFPVSTQ